MGADLPRRYIKGAMLVGSAVMLSACLGGPEASSGTMPFGKGLHFLAPKASQATEGQGAFAQADPQAQGATAKEYSPLIADLQARRSVLPAGSSYARVASSVAATSRSAGADLRAARLRAVAASKNWLPTIGPSISLSSLGDFVASLVVETVLFDNGRKKAERDFARADVEVAAVALSQDVNDRVNEALTLYVAALEAREKADLAGKGLTQMREYDRIIARRVEGGVSDMSELQVVRAKISEMEGQQARFAEAAETALAELAAMAGGRVEAAGLTELSVPHLGADALAVKLAQSEARRAQAQATMERAGALPRLTASAKVGGGGGASINGGGAALGLGTGARLQAADAAREAASLRVAEAEEAVARRSARLEQRLQAAARQAGEARALAAQSTENLRLFERQFQTGQRRMLDLVRMYETVIDQSMDAIDLKYEVPVLQLEIAREMGALVSGAEI